MKVTPLPKFHLKPEQATFYDGDSATMLELASRLHTKINEVVKYQNEFSEELSIALQNLDDEVTNWMETFQTSARQEFQDFIDAVDLKISALEAKIK